MVDWREDKDRLHCSPDFHHHSRYDGVIVESAQAPIFAILLSIFTVTVQSTSYPLAFVLPLDAATGARRIKDRQLCLHRVRARANPSFISTQAIIRGALLAKTHDRDGDHFVVDTVDEEMLLRMRQMFPEVSMIIKPLFILETC